MRSSWHLHMNLFIKQEQIRETNISISIVQCTYIYPKGTCNIWKIIYKKNDTQGKLVPNQLMSKNLTQNIFIYLCHLTALRKSQPELHISRVDEGI